MRVSRPAPPVRFSGLIGLGAFRPRAAGRAKRPLNGAQQVRQEGSPFCRIDLRHPWPRRFRPSNASLGAEARRRAPRRADQLLVPVAVTNVHPERAIVGERLVDVRENIGQSVDVLLRLAVAGEKYKTAFSRRARSRSDFRCLTPFQKIRSFQGYERPMWH